MTDPAVTNGFRASAPELLQYIADVAGETLVKLAALDEEIAEQVGIEIANRLATDWGGQLIYMPAGVAVQISQRDQAVYAEFNGKNHSELARKYQISLQWVYKIVSRCRAMEKRQGSLL